MKTFLHRSITPLLLAGFVLAHDATAQIQSLSINKGTGSFLWGAPPAVQYADWDPSEFRLAGLQMLATGKQFRVNNTITLSASSDGFTFTVPASGTAALLGVNNVFTGSQNTFRDIFIDTPDADLFLKDLNTGFEVATTEIVTLQANNSFRSRSYTSGLVGHMIDADGNAEFNNIIARGEFRASVFKINELAATAGTFGVFYSASTLTVDCLTAATPGAGMSITAKNSDAGGMLFGVGDKVRIKSWTGSSVSDVWATITSRTNNGPDTTYGANFESGTASAYFYAGTAIVDYGPPNTGYITLSTDGTVGSSPNLTMATHAGSPWSAQTIRARSGNLNGYGPYATDIYGFGAGQYGAAGQTSFFVDPTNGFRVFNNTTLRIHLAADGSGFLATNAISWNAAGDTTISGFSIGSDYFRDNANSFGLASTVTGGDDVRFWAGSTFANRGTAPLRFTEAGNLFASNANITGAINATSGSITGVMSVTGSGSFEAGGGRVQLNSSGIQLGTGLTGGLYSASDAVKWITSGHTVGEVYTLYDNGGSATSLTARPKSSDSSGVASAALYSLFDNGNRGASIVAQSYSGPDNSYVTIEGITGSFSGVRIAATPGFGAPGHLLDVLGTGWFQTSVESPLGTFTKTSATTNTVERTLFVQRLTSGTVANNIGAGMEFYTQYNSGAYRAAAIDAIDINVTNGDSALALSVNRGGVGFVEAVRITGPNIRFNQYGAGTLSTDASGNITATSDERLKDIEGDYTRGLEELLAIQPKFGRWKESTSYDRTQKYVWPVTAQNALETIPEAVGMDGSDHYTVDQNGLNALLVNSVKQLAAITAALENKPLPTLKKDDRAQKRIAELRDAKRKRDENVPLVPTPTPKPSKKL